MKVLHIVVALIIGTITCQAQDLAKKSWSGNLTYYYRLTSQQAKRYILKHGDVNHDSLLTDLAYTILTDSAKSFIPDKPGYYIKVNLQYLTVNTSLVIHSPFVYDSKGITGEGQLRVFDLKGKEITDADVTLHKNPVAYNLGCGCYSFPSQESRALLQISKGDLFDFQWISNLGLINQHVDRGNPYAGSPFVYLGYLQTSQPQYRHFDTLKVKAFITNQNGRPITQRLNAYLVGNNKEYRIGEVKAPTRGAYVFQFPLWDSLQLGDYSVQLRIGSRQVMQNNFGLQDYELRKANYQASSNAYNFTRLDDVKLIAEATDANGLPMFDTRIKARLSLQGVNKLYVDELDLTKAQYENLWEYDKMIDVTGKTVELIPKDVFLPLKGIYKLAITLINAAGEYRDFTSTFDYDGSTRYLIPSQKGWNFSLQNYPKKDKNRRVTIQAFSERNKQLYELKDVQLPWSEKMNISTRYYKIWEHDSLLFTYSVKDLSSDFITVDGYRTKDSVVIKLKNPLMIPLNYRLYHNATRFKGDTTRQFEFKKQDLKESSYTIIYKYLWAGKEHIIEKLLYVKEKDLTISVDQPKQVFPGDRVHVKIHVQDYKGRPKKKTNLLAYAVNKEFGDIPEPEMPYFGNTYPKWLQYTGFNLQNPAVFKNFPLRYKWLEKAPLNDSDYIIHFLFPENKIIKNVSKIGYSDPELCINLFKNGRIEPILTIWANGVAVYENSNSANEIIPFVIKPGTYDFVVQTFSYRYAFTQTVESFKKYFISWDANRVSSSAVKRDSMESPSYRDADLRNLHNSTLYVEIPNYTDTIWIENDGLKRVIFANSSNNLTKKYTPLYSRYYATITGLKPGNTIMRMGRDTLYFSFVPGNFYYVKDHLMQSFPMEGYPLNDAILTVKPNYKAFSEIILQRPLRMMKEANKVKKEIEKRNFIAPKPQTWLESLEVNFYNGTRPKEQKCRLQILSNTDLPVQYAWLIHNDNERMSLSQYHLTFPMLAEGSYSMVVLLQDGSFWRKDNLVMTDENWHLLQLNKEEFRPFAKEQLQPYYEQIHHISREKIYDGNLVPIVESSILPSYKPFKGTGAAVWGKVKRDNDQVAVRVVVSIEQNGKFIAATYTNSWGEFFIDSLPEGNFTLKLRGENVYPQVFENLVLKTGFVATCQVQLKPLKDEWIAEDFEVDIPENVSFNGGSYAFGVNEVNYYNKTEFGIDEMEKINAFESSSKLQAIETIVEKSAILYDNYGGRITSPIPYLSDNDDDRLYEGEFEDSWYIPDPLDTNQYKKQFNQGREPSHRLRHNFRDCAYWVPNLLTDKQGNAYYSAQFPDNITQWKTIIPAFNYHRYTGLFVTDVSAFLPYSGQLAMPRFLIKGDQIDLSTKVSNYTDSALSVNLKLSLKDSLLWSQSALVKEFSTFTQHITAPQTDSAQFNFTMLKGEQLLDGEKRTIPLMNPFGLRHDAMVVNANRDTTFTITAPAGVEQNIIVLNGKRAFIHEQIELLQHYEYGCTEQTASKLRALLIQKKLCAEDNRPFENEKLIMPLIARLSASQKLNGAWGWWPNATADQWMTIYVGQVLVKAQEMGYNSIALSRAMGYLGRNAKKMATGDKLEVMALQLSYGQNLGDAPLENIVYASLNEHDKLLYLRVNKMLTGKKAGPEVIKLLHKNSCGALYWGSDESAFYRKSRISTVLAAQLLTDEGDYPAVVKAIEKSLLNPDCNLSLNTLERASLIALLASQPKTNSKPGKISLNGMLVEEFPYRRSMKPGETINVKMQGDDNKMMVNSEVKITDASDEKAYFRLKGEFQQKGKAVATLTKGESTVFVLQVNSNIVAHHVMIEIPIPAGCSQSLVSPVPNALETYRELYKNKLLIYCETIPAGQHSFSLSLEPRFSGQFHLPPAQVECMYEPNKNGNTAMQVITVQ